MVRRALLLVGLLSLAAGCASDPAKRQKIVSEEAARLRPPQVPLASFGSFEILPVATSPEVASKPEKVEMVTRLGQDLEARLRPMLKSWEASAAPEARGRILVIQAKVTSLHVVSGGARFFIGALAGNSSIDMDLTLSDKQSGQVIASERINKSSDAMAGAWSIGSSDRNLPEYVVEIALEYLSRSHK